MSSAAKDTVKIGVPVSFKTASDLGMLVDGFKVDLRISATVVVNRRVSV
jgi:hypothetical protein